MVILSRFSDDGGDDDGGRGDGEGDGNGDDGTSMCDDGAGHLGNLGNLGADVGLGLKLGIALGDLVKNDGDLVKNDDDLVKSDDLVVGRGVELSDNDDVKLSTQPRGDLVKIRRNHNKRAFKFKFKSIFYRFQCSSGGEGSSAALTASSRIHECCSSLLKRSQNVSNHFLFWSSSDTCFSHRCLDGTIIPLHC